MCTAPTLNEKQRMYTIPEINEKQRIYIPKPNRKQRMCGVYGLHFPGISTVKYKSAKWPNVSSRETEFSTVAAYH